MGRFKWGISTTDEAPDTSPLLLKGTIIENLRKAGELGYSAIEVHTREEAAFDYDAIDAAMEETGVRIAQIVTGRLNTEGGCDIMDDRPYVTAAALASLHKYIDIAARLRADIVLGWAKGNVPAGKNPDKYMDRLARHLSILNAYAKEKDVRINIEIMNHYETNVFTTSKELRDFLDVHDLENCRMHLDTFHMSLEESDMAAAIRTAGDRLGYFHIADNQRWYPGSGMLDFASMFDALDEIGYHGYVTLECFPKGDGVKTARKAVEFLNSL